MVGCRDPWSVRQSSSGAAAQNHQSAGKDSLSCALDPFFGQIVQMYVIQASDLIAAHTHKYPSYVFKPKPVCRMNVIKRSH